MLVRFGWNVIVCVHVCEPDLRYACMPGFLTAWSPAVVPCLHSWHLSVVLFHFCRWDTAYQDAAAKVEYGGAGEFEMEKVSCLCLLMFNRMCWHTCATAYKVKGSTQVGFGSYRSMHLCDCNAFVHTFVCSSPKSWSTICSSWVLPLWKTHCRSVKIFYRDAWLFL